MKTGILIKTQVKIGHSWLDQVNTERNHLCISSRPSSDEKGREVLYPMLVTVTLIMNAAYLNSRMGAAKFVEAF